LAAGGDLHIAEAALSAPRSELARLRAFYRRLGLEAAAAADGSVVVGAGASTLRLVPAAGRPWHHVALLVAPERFAESTAIVRDMTPLLADPRDGSTIFESPEWHSRACYFHDPAGNVVELIAHAELASPEASGSPLGVLAISEVGLVAPDPDRLIDLLTGEAGLRVWDGDPPGNASLSFVGRKGHTLIVAVEGRGWVPTRRPAEVHPVAVTIDGAGRVATVEPPGLPYRVRVRRP
jgi:catechol 2,3-dioxygenase-like lactoylglutathione lyase family enzyme